MALCFVRWYDPRRQATLRRDFNSKPEAEAFRARLPYLSEPAKHYPAAKRKSQAKPKPERVAITWPR